ncbi:C-type lectin protein [Vararia minispora EC-137]|uniref:C-type lectin protein n=1 Tax=Vararia minispora EC-137 TaxID=1314806 RepID=A0ACB8QIR9_9AGAM|nr:C-type lectin protein [Vararia minispora EC-137]
MFYTSGSCGTSDNAIKLENISSDSTLVRAHSLPSTTASHLPLQSLTDAQQTFTAASLSSQIALVSASAAVTLHILYRPPFLFPRLQTTSPSPLNPTAHPFGIPSMQDWTELWKAWDCVTLGMIPRTMLHEKPIDLRHKCIFYLGHIPTFLDMLLSRELGEPNTEPKWFTEIFERGIDPHVDDPEHCHRHSIVPTKDDEWPTLDDIVAFRTRVRARLLQLYADLEAGRRTIYRRLARVLVMTFEHEGFHVETLLYMLIQRTGTGTLPPPGFPRPLFAPLAAQWAQHPTPPTPTITLGPADITLGFDDPEPADLDPAHAYNTAARAYGWDNESPARTVRVSAFRASWRPVTNGAYLAWWRGAGAGRPAPKSWAVGKDGVVNVRTAFGLVPLEVASEWPVMAAYDDLAAFARDQGGRLPSEAELRLFLDTYDVQENIGFRHWHPLPATCGTEGKKGSNGGVWEWTSTLFDAHDGFEPTDIFSGYSSDFFDGVHHVVLGASYATIPRQAGRRTLRNFYQHNYPYAWVGGRVVYDVEA